MRYPKDPYWTAARFSSTCTRCKKAIRKGESIFYFPNCKSVYCNDDNCGEKESRQFNSYVFDETQYNTN